MVERTDGGDWTAVLAGVLATLTERFAAEQAAGTLTALSDQQIAEWQVDALRLAGFTITPAALRWTAGQVNECEGGSTHDVATLHVCARCACGAAFQSTDAGLALGMAQAHTKASPNTSSTTPVEAP